MFFTCSHLTTRGVGRGWPGRGHATKEASFEFLFSFSPLQKVPPLPPRAGLALTQELAARAWPGFSSAPQPPSGSGKEKAPGAALGKLGCGSSREARQAWSGAAWSCGEGRERDRGRGGTRLHKNQEKVQREQHVLRHRRAAGASVTALPIPRGRLVLPNVLLLQMHRGDGRRRGSCLSEEPLGQGCSFLSHLPALPAHPGREAASKLGLAAFFHNNFNF